MSARVESVHAVAGRIDDRRTVELSQDPGAGRTPPKLMDTLHFRLSRREHEILRQLADRECSTVSQIVRRIVSRELRRDPGSTDPPALAVHPRRPRVA